MSAMKDESFVSRNHALRFAQLTRENLEYIENASRGGQPVHVVTQLANSLLGLVVFLWERNFVNAIDKLTLEELTKSGWPLIAAERGECQTLGQFVRHLRNAVAHGRITFSSDSMNMNEVTIRIQDKKPNSPEPDWCVRMHAPDLRAFCVRFVALVDSTIG